MTTTTPSQMLNVWQIYCRPKKLVEHQLYPWNIWCVSYLGKIETEPSEKSNNNEEEAYATFFEQP